MAIAEIYADLRGEVDGKKFSIRSSGRQTVVEVPDVATGLRLVQLGSSRGDFRRSIRQLQRMLETTFHRVEIRIGSTPVASIGHGVGTRFWNLLGLPRLCLKPLALASQLLTRPKRGEARRTEPDTRG